MKNLVILTGAGMSAESGIKTFRDAGGLWEGHDVMEVASPQGWENNQDLVLEFYNQRRKQLLHAKPNAGHLGLAELEQDFNVQIITQNVDDLHERAGSTEVLHIHGELFKVRSIADENDIQTWKKDLNKGDLCTEGFQLRPHIVWFGEAVPLLTVAIEMVQKAAVFVVIGTSMQVYPAASLIQYVPTGVPIYFIDPKPSISKLAFPNLTILAEKASVGVNKLQTILK